MESSHECLWVRRKKNRLCSYTSYLCLPPTSFPLVMVRTPVPPTRQLHITAPRAPCLVLPLVHWVGLDPVLPHPPIHHPPLHSKYSTVFLSLLTQAKVINSFIY